MNLEKEFKKIDNYWLEIRDQKMALDKKLEDTKKDLENYISKEFEKTLKKVDLKGYSVLEYNVNYDPNPAHRINFIGISKILTPEKKILNGKEQITFDLLTNVLKIGTLKGKEYVDKNILEFVKKFRVEYIFQADSKK